MNEATKQVIAKRFLAGDSISFLINDFGFRRIDVERSIRRYCELKCDQNLEEQDHE